MHRHTPCHPSPCGLSRSLKDVTVAVTLTLFTLAFVYVYLMIAGAEV